MKCDIFIMSLLVTITLNAAYPTMEEARSLLSPELVCSTNIEYWRNGEYRLFLNRLSDPVDAVSRRSVETYVISSITSLVVNVSTNLVDDGIRRWLLEDRGISFAQFAFCCGDLATNTNNCFALARYASTIHGVDYPLNLVGKRLSITGFVDDMPSDFSQRMNDFYERRDLQQRVYGVNRAVEEYRLFILSMCNFTVRSLFGKINDDEFSSFTNRLVQLSGADEKGRRRLFSYMKR